MVTLSVISCKNIYDSLLLKDATVNAAINISQVAVTERNMESARDLAEERLARGEITSDEFKVIIDRLSESGRDRLKSSHNPVRPARHSESRESGVGFPDRYAEPSAINEISYVGFWSRVGAAVIDTLLIVILTLPLVTLYYGSSYWTNDEIYQGPVDIVITQILPAFLIIIFWIKLQATPGKLAVSAKIVDANTGGPASSGKLIVRYLAYFLSLIALGLGVVWIAFDRRKQGWHDKLAGTVVVRSARRHQGNNLR